MYNCEIGFSEGCSTLPTKRLSIVLERKNPQVGAGRYSGDNPNNPRHSVEAIQENYITCHPEFILVGTILAVISEICYITP